MLNRRVVLHAIDASPARWRGDAGSLLLDRARTAAPSPRNDLASDTLVDFHTGARHAADPLHALDAGRALVHDDLHVRRGAGLSFFRLDGAGARARRVEGREDNSDAATPPGARAGTRGDLNHTKTQVRRDAQVHDAGDVARGRRRRHGRRPAPGRLDREVDLLLGRPPPPLPPPEVYITHPL